MRVFMIAGDFPPRISGVGDYCAHVSRSLDALGIPVTVVTSTLERPADAWSNGSVDVRYSISRWKMSEGNKILGMIGSSGPRSIVNIQYNCPTAYGRRLLINFLPAMMRVRYPSARVVVTMHGYWEQSILFRLRTLPMLRAAHGVIYVDRLNRNLIAKYGGFDDRHMKFIPVGSNILPVPCSPEVRDTWRQQLGFTEGDIVVAFFGGIGRSKGFEYLMNALRQIRVNEGLPVMLLAIGGFHADGVNQEYQKSVRTLIGQQDIAPWVKVVDSPGERMVSQCLHCADMGVFPFILGVGENSGSMLASLSHGLPTIISEGPANDHSFAERFGVVMVPARDGRSLSDAILRVVRSKDEMQLMRSNALMASRRLNWEYLARETATFFEALFL